MVLLDKSQVPQGIECHGLMSISRSRSRSGSRSWSQSRSAKHWCSSFQIRKNDSSFRCSANTSFWSSRNVICPFNAHMGGLLWYREWRISLWSWIITWKDNPTLVLLEHRFTYETIAALPQHTWPLLHCHSTPDHCCTATAHVTSDEFFIILVKRNRVFFYVSARM